MNKEHLYQPQMRRLPNHGHDNYFIVDGHSQEILLKIRNLLDVLRLLETTTGMDFG